MTYQVAILGCIAVLLTGGSRSPDALERPNFLIILADDMGFSDAGSYGGEIRTPNIDGMAANGLRFTRFYNTGRCWPTRSSLLTGYYAQQIRMDPPAGALPDWALLMPHYLKPWGYRSYHAGKWHVLGAPNPIEHAGFHRSYKLVDQDRFFSPQQHHLNDQPLPAVARENGYYATTAITDYALQWLDEHAEKHAEKPFLLYLAFTAPHFPLQALQEDIEPYRDHYLAGWDVVRQERWTRLQAQGIVAGSLPARDEHLTPRYWQDEVMVQIGPGEVKHAVAWEGLTEAQKRLQATKMAIHAAMIDRMDREIGRVLNGLEAMGELENTVIFFLSDNGADATLMSRGDGHDPTALPGSASSYLTLGPGWATVANTPFRYHKIWVHEGGIATPLIVQWPKGIKARGELRHTVGHVIDLVPTILDLAGAQTSTALQHPNAPPLPGRSLVPVFDKDGAIDRDFLFFHHEGNRALRVGDDKLVSAKENGDTWELYDLGQDRSETVDRATQQPDRVEHLKGLWEALESTFRQQAGKP
jgi:arylsulfatase